MSIRVANTQLGFVAREIFPCGERAYRYGHNGTWSYCPDHKGPWIVVRPAEVPFRFVDAITDFRQNA